MSDAGVEAKVNASTYSLDDVRDILAMKPDAPLVTLSMLRSILAIADDLTAAVKGKDEEIAALKAGVLCHRCDNAIHEPGVFFHDRCLADYVDGASFDLTARLAANSRLIKSIDEENHGQEVIITDLRARLAAAPVCPQHETMAEEMTDLRARLAAAEGELKWVKADYATTLDVKNLLQHELADLTARLAAKDTALEFAEGAIDDAITADDGLDGLTGEKVLHILREARESGTFDREPFDRARLPMAIIGALQEQIDGLAAAAEQAMKTMLHLPMCGCDHAQNDPSCHVGILRAALTSPPGGPR